MAEYDDDDDDDDHLPLQMPRVKAENVFLT